MPLIVMCGYPCSGKTRRAEELKVYFEERCDRKVHVVGDGAVDVERNTVYAGEFVAVQVLSTAVIQKFPTASL